MNRIVLPAAFLMLGLMGTSVFAQTATEQQESSPTRVYGTLPIAPRAPGMIYRPIRQGDGGVAWAAESRSGNGVASMMKKYKAAESRSDKDEVLSELRDMLSEQYDKSLEAQEKRLDEMETKLKKLRTQLDKRNEAKVEIVDLRIDVLVKEAEGLGWPDSRTQTFFEPSFVPGPPGYLGRSNLVSPSYSTQSNVLSPFDTAVLEEPAKPEVSPKEPTRSRSSSERRSRTNKQ